MKAQEKPRQHIIHGLLNPGGETLLISSRESLLETFECPPCPPAILLPLLV